ncbi:hypothetical protein PAPYR_1610 [Paratrimastix pyriformis]|uniref:Uncharacterized protein n=1 Tax=Paratrimastix pyriformis TaxID=342808 RepID=A0ABQ8UUZ1_9EUKA|nr:hypothetical protein PAPYR_1610 [Paratrimastix pyriformis]
MSVNLGGSVSDPDHVALGRPSTPSGGSTSRWRLLALPPLPPSPLPAPLVWTGSINEWTAGALCAQTRPHPPSCPAGPPSTAHLVLDRWVATGGQVNVGLQVDSVRVATGGGRETRGDVDLEAVGHGRLGLAEAEPCAHVGDVPSPQPQSGAAAGGLPPCTVSACYLSVHALGTSPRPAPHPAGS